MKYSFIFFLSGIYLIMLGLRLGNARWLILWTGVSFIAVGAAYGWLGAKVFGKRSDGTMGWLNICLLMPYLLLTWITWHLQRLIEKEECCNEIAPGIWLGRRVFLNEFPDNISLIVDLTAEFPEPKNVISGRAYICVPTLDASVPDYQVFQKLIDKICAWQGNIYIHCALGHGRSATVVAATLVAKGLVNNANQAEALIKNKRSGIEFSKAQRDLLKRLTI
ncbi:dual specificity protein phosphatase family protein [Coleofasciculus sp. FACHB-64]|uniref:dual specificity protein phosphatase family protein n=1 Tax=Cyanophyceae TaxID=3028117 RepID=UPI00168280E2|nr:MULTISPECIES: dual specificity protein phosphatase family protein [unclassified Coleofasciculus]MBD1836928.1 dual specificity protein phosphatase family protein [Coleofasciculus sp. FACHB-501]MBD2046866.1 dual specificity protein phosphatase family protein [Coleofasciculus sp. FACHB-64]